MSTNASLLKGSIKDFGLVEILQMMGLGGMTGALHLKQSTGHVGVIYVTDGKIAGCSELESGALTLGDVLQQLRLATHTQIEEAFSQQLQDVLASLSASV